MNKVRFRSLVYGKHKLRSFNVVISTGGEDPRLTSPQRIVNLENEVARLEARIDDLYQGLDALLELFEHLGR